MKKPELIPDTPKKLQQTISASISAFYEGQAAEPISSLEFLWKQARFIRKRWWLLQASLLVLLLIVLIFADSLTLPEIKIICAVAPLFVILALPELNKSRRYETMETECAAFFSLRQICAARLTLFAGMDFLLLSLFFLGASTMANIPFWELLVNFMLPLIVSCCICFRCLYAVGRNSETLSIFLCALFTVVWEQVISVEKIYYAISRPMWIAMFALSLSYLIYCVCQGQRNLQKQWEVQPLWN